MCAALSDSLLSEVGQKALALSLLESLFTGAPIFSNHDLLLAFVFPQVDACENVYCDDILDAEVGGGCLGNLGVEVKGN